MLIAHIINGLESGGAEATMFNLCINDTINKHVVVSLLDQGKYYKPLVESGVEVYCLDLKGKGSLLLKLHYLYRLIKTLKPDVVQTWMYHSDLLGGVIARFAGVRKVFWGVHNTILTPDLNKRTTIWVSKVCSLLSHVVPFRIICCADKSLTVHASIGYSRSIMQVVNNGYDLSKFYQNPIFAEEFLSDINCVDSEVLLGCVGRFDPAKDHRNLIKALAMVKQRGIKFRCLLAGNQMTIENLELVGWLKESNLENEIILAGIQNNIPAVMNAIDIHILSSVAEAFPNVLCEAMACGTPCVTTDVGDAAIIVEQTGWVVPAEDPEKLADAICIATELHKNKACWQQRQANCRERIVTNFSIDKMVQSYLAVWNSNV